MTTTNESLPGWHERLMQGTLHVGYCNGDHSQRVGKAGMICNCPLGQEIQTLRRERDEARAACARSEAMLRVVGEEVKLARAALQQGAQGGEELVSIPGAISIEQYAEQHRGDQQRDAALKRARNAMQSQQEPVAWKQAFEEEARKFQQETRRTSEMAKLLSRWVDRGPALGCTPDKWPKACATCDLLRESKELLEASINTTPQAAQPAVAVPDGWQFKIGDCVTKINGSQWSGLVVGFYSTLLTPEGYAVESDSHPGSVQIYPAKALALLSAKETP